MKKTRKVFLSLLTVLLIGIGFLCGCSDSKTDTVEGNTNTPTMVSGQTLEAYFDAHSDEKAEMLDGIAKQSTDYFTMVGDVKGNEIIYNATFATQLEGDAYNATKTSLEGQEESLKKSFSEVAKEISDATGISGVTVTANYLNKDGSLIWSCSATDISQQ